MDVKWMVCIGLLWCFNMCCVFESVAAVCKRAIVFCIRVAFTRLLGTCELDGWMEMDGWIDGWIDERVMACT